MEWKTRTLILIALIGVGLVFEGLKSVPRSASPFLKGEIFKPYAITDKILNLSRNRYVSPPATAPKITVTPNPEFDMKSAIANFEAEHQKLIEENKKRLAEQKRWHWVWDKKNNKWVWKKKKKKKETKETAVARQDDSPATPQTPEVKKPSPPAQPIRPDTVTTTQTKPNVTATITSAHNFRFLSLAEWKNRLLTKPDSAATAEFVRQYKQHLVTETVFYQVVDAMLKDSRPDMQAQGVSALGQTPSAHSFIELATLSSTLQTSSPLYATVTADLNKYAELNNVDDLQQVMSTQQTASVLTLAEQQLMTSIQNNLGSGAPTPTGGKIAYYKPFTPILTQLQQNPDTNVASQAGQILGLLNGYLQAAN